MEMICGNDLWKRFMETKLQKNYLEYCRVRNKVKKNMITYFRKQKEKIISMDTKSLLEIH